jgi:CheY-like chemotaxis protein
MLLESRTPNREPERAARILVVDDEPQIGTAIVRILKEHQVVVETTGTSALLLLESDAAFDLVLCDVTMMDLSGQAFFAHLRARWPELAERLVFISGGAFTPETEEFLKNTARPCLPKPFGAAELRNYVKSLLAVGAARTANGGPERSA